MPISTQRSSDLLLRASIYQVLLASNFDNESQTQYNATANTIQLSSTQLNSTYIELKETTHKYKQIERETKIKFHSILSIQFNIMATSALPLRKLSSQSPPFNPNRILLRDQSNSPVPPPSSYASRSRSSSPYFNGRGGGTGGSVGGGTGAGIGTPVGKGSGGVGRGRMKYPTNPNAAHSNAIPKHTFEHNV